MTTSSDFQSLLPTIQVYQSTVDDSTTPLGYTFRGEFIGEITDQLSSYNHTVTAFGGYQQANFEIDDKLVKVEDWLERGLMRHIEVYDQTLTRIWEGFVNQITVTIGSLTIVRGPLMDISTRAGVMYSTIDTTVDPPIMGIRAFTNFANNDDAVSKWGRWLVIVSGGGMTADEALEVRSQFLVERSQPKTTQSFNLGGTAAPRVSVSCLGYVHRMSTYFYTNSGAGTHNASTRIQYIIEDQPNLILDENHDGIDTNTIQVRVAENEFPKALDAVKAVVAQGDASDNRWLFGVYNDATPYYNQAPTTIQYVQRLSDEGQQFFDSNDELVYPWQILPGKWLQFSDLLIGRIDVSTDLRNDPRAMFIESVQFTAPWSLQLQGGQTDTLNQKLAKMGLAGVSS